jgi:hypothetical protein
VPHASTPLKAYARFKPLSALLVALGILVPSLPPSLAQAAEDATPWSDKITNPSPADGDVTLPMPCGGAMVFRKVSVPANDIYADYKITIGTNDERYGYSEGARTAYMAGSFSGESHQRYTLVGKYEVSVAQYEAVMQAAAGKPCGRAPTMAKRLPQADVSWMDAVAFSDAYSRWLLTQAPKALPKEDGQPGYIRLPTEVEWEFAARGGIKVSPSDFSERLFPMPDGMAKYVWYAGTQSANGKPQLTGLLAPNPLGLHDMIGNVDEIILEPFHLNRLDRLHGQAGSYVVRGGNYLTDGQDMRASYRQEVPYYDAKGPRHSKTTGFRVVVAAPVVTSPQRLEALQKEWSALGSVSAPTPLAKASDDPLEELALLAKSEQDPAVKARLLGLQTALRGNIAARDALRDRAAKTMLRMGAFLGRKLSDDGHAVSTLERVYKGRLETSPADDPRTQTYKEQLDREQAVLDGNLRYYADTLIRTADDFGDDALAGQKDLLLVELEGMGLGQMKPYVELYFSHVMTYREDKRISRYEWLADWSKLQ